MNSVKGGYDEVEFLYSRPPQPFTCQFCGMELSKLKEERRQAHYEDHLSSQGSASSPGPTRDSQGDKKNVFWRPSFETLPPSNFTPNLIPLLKRTLMTSHQNGVTRKAALCNDKSVHVGVEKWDLTWGCGYRNFLMACIALMEQTTQPGYAKLLKKPIPPGVDNLQRWIEDAWDLGYDAAGANELRRRLVGTTKWIGTAELYVAFVSRGVPCNLVDFHTDQKGSAAEKTVNDVLNGAVTVTERMPLVLQHAGHSRTVVGYEVERNGECNILVFDPSKQLRPPLRTAAVGPQDSVRMSLGPPRDRKLMDRIKDTVFSPINEMKARKRKASPAVIDLTRPTQKRPRSASSSDIVVLDEPIETSEPINVDVESQPGRPPPIELKDEQSSTRVDVMEGMLSWSRLSMKQIRRKDKYQILHFPLTAPLADVDKSQRRVVTSLKL